MEFSKKEQEALKWLLIKGMEITTSDKKYEIFDNIHERLVKNCSIPDVSNFVLLAKPNYKAKDGTIKRGIEIDGKYYAPKNDC